MNESRKPSLLTGAVVGLMLTVSLIAIFYLATQLIGTPFVPFDVFDWVGRNLPGPLISFGIDRIVDVVTGLNLGETSSAAKTAEHALAVGGMLATGIIAAIVLFAILPRVKPRYLVGLLVGLAVGVPVMLISSSVNLTATAGPLVNNLWIVAAFAVWGVALAWVYVRLEGTQMAAAATVEQIDRRRFLITLGGATAAITVAGTGVGLLLRPEESEVIPTTTALNATEPEVAWSAGNNLPNVDATPLPAPGTRPEFTPLDRHYRIDINSLPPTVREEDWTLEITGLVDTPTRLTLTELRENFDPLDQFVTLSCISNPMAGDLISTQYWTGAPLRDVMAVANLKPEATHLRITSADNFDEVVDLETVMADERVMLAYAWDGLPLRVKHGFPLRVYIPNHYGMKQPKWITKIEAIPQWEEGYWVRRGWDKDAIMRGTSVIDTVAANDVVTDGNRQLIPIGGIAHAGARGISKVEVKIDDGDWATAELRTPLSEVTWVVWRYDWAFEAGSHTFTVRCVDGDGEPQIEMVAGSHPSGATGLHTTRGTI